MSRLKSNTTDKTEATEKASSFLSEYAGEIIDAIKHAYNFQKDNQLAVHLNISSQSIANARKKIPIEWVFRCRQETGVEIGSLLPVTGWRSNDKEVPMNFLGIGKRIQEARGHTPLTIFAQSLDVHKNTVIRWEKGDCFPGADLVRKMCETYHIDPTWLIMGKSLQEIKTVKVLATITRMVDTLDKMGIDLPTAKKVELIAKLSAQEIEAE
jgi:transcriptional regulator with XRE-family HTH domain